VDAEDALGYGMVGCIRKLEFSEQLHFSEIRLSVSFRSIIVSVDTDIRRKFIHAGYPDWRAC
jgi:hypothetical protein